jgi:hypothetical protein
VVIGELICPRFRVSNRASLRVPSHCLSIIHNHSSSSPFTHHSSLHRDPSCFSLHSSEILFPQLPFLNKNKL